MPQFDLAVSIQPRQEDLRAAGELLKSRILKRTAEGVDYENRQFAPYSTKGPYYYYPKGHIGNRSVSQGRFLKALGASPGKRASVGQRFDSYSAFKHEGLGRPNVDLMGADPPHMLDQIQVLADGRQLALVIDGDAGDRATGHNEGTKTLPQREFFNASEEDIDAMLSLIEQRIADRWDSLRNIPAA